MTHEERIQRINELARKSRTEGLTREEVAEQQVLRQEYLAVFRQNFRQQLEAIKNRNHDHCHDPNCSCHNHNHNHNHRKH